MTAGKLRSFLEHVYMLAVCAFLLWDIPYMTEAQWTFEVREAFPAVWYGLAAAALVLCRFRMGAVWLPVGLVAWMTAVSVYRGVMHAQAEPIASGVLAFLVMLPAARVVRTNRLMKYLRGLLAVWTACLTLQSALGLWTALSGYAVRSLQGTWFIGVNLGDHRLYLNAFVTTGAVKLGLSVLLAAFGAVSSPGRARKTAYALCAALQLLCLSLTDCRTAFIAVGAGLGLMLAAALLKGGKPRRVLRTVCAAMLVPVMAAGMYLTLSATLTALAPHVPQEQEMLMLDELPAHLLPRAEAETAGEAGEAGVQHRKLESGNLFNDRQIIWRATAQLLREEPKFLVTGLTTALVPDEANARIPQGEYEGKPFQHVHSIYLQTLVSWGVPGLLLLGALLAIVLLASLRVLLRHELPLWQRLTPVPALYVMLCESIDCFTRLSENSPLLHFACLFAGLTLAIDLRARLDARSKRPVGAAVDVIIPVYNACGYVARAAQSALACGAARVLLVDDGSTDGSGLVCDGLAAQDQRVCVLHQPNRGASAARNAGLAASTAEFVAFLDADDVLLPGALAALVEKMGDADAIQGRIVLKTPEGIPCERVTRLEGREILRAAMADPTRRLLCHGWLLRRSLMTAGFDEGLTMGEDGEWMLRTLSCAGSAAFCDVPAYRYTVRADSALHSGSPDVNGEYLRTLEAADNTLKALEMPESAAMYRLTHLLLMLTHGDMEAALRLRDKPLFDDAFRTVKLTGFTPRIMTLRLLRARRYGLVRLVVRMRRRWNECRCEMHDNSRNQPHKSEVQPG